MSAADKRDIKLNTRREILFLEATLHYDNDVFVDFTKFSDYFVIISKESANVIRRPKIAAFTMTSDEDISNTNRFVYSLKGQARYQILTLLHRYDEAKLSSFYSCSIKAFLRAGN